MSETKLMPCPCCGKKDQIKIENGWKIGSCDRCGMFISVPYGKGQKK